MAITPGSRAERDVFDALVDADAIAIIGASSDPASLSGRPLEYLARHGYAGRIYPVNPRRDFIQGLKAYRTILDVPERVDVAMVAVPAAVVPGVLRECSEADVRIAVVVSSGFGEGQGAGAELRAEVVDLVSTTSMRIIGPNCEGLVSMPNHMPLTFSPVVDVERTGREIRHGDVAVLSQSGGLGFAVAAWGIAVGLGFSYVVSTGNEIDVDAIEVAERLVERDDVRVLVLLVEGFERQERLEHLGARAARLGKHVVAAKLGRTPAGRRGARAHTQHDAGDPDAYRELFSRAGVHQAFDEEELIDTVQVLARAPKLGGRRLAIVTTSGGGGVWLTDQCEAAGFEIPILSEGLQAQLATMMPGYGSPLNPVDLTAQYFEVGRFSTVAELLLASDEVDGLVIVTSLALSGRLEQERDGLADVTARFDKPLLMFSYTQPAPSSVDILADLGIAWFETTARTARALVRLARASGQSLA